MDVSLLGIPPTIVVRTKSGVFVWLGRKKCLELAQEAGFAAKWVA
jgi:hypothetical protein